jgi:predicted dehydrogenase
MIRIGIIGTGIGLSHAKIASKIPGAVVAGICGHNEEKTKNFAKELGIPFWTADYKKLLNELIDLVVIASPNDQHFPMFLQALRHEKHIVVEKPAGVSTKEIDEAIMASSKYKQLVVVNHELRFHPLFSKVKGCIQDGRMGNISLVELSYTHNLFSNPDYKYSWMNDKKSGGGQLQLMGTHLLDLANHWLGFPKAEGISIKTTISVPKRPGPDGRQRKVTAEDTFTLNGSLGNTLICLSNGTLGFGYKGLSFKIHGAKGFLIFDEERGLRGCFGFGKMEQVVTQSPINLKEGVFKTGLELFWSELINRITGNQIETSDSRFCTLDQARTVQEIIHK